MTDAGLLALLSHGVDHRAMFDPHTGLNSYGGAPRARSLPLGSCTASEPEPELLAVALRTLARDDSPSHRCQRIRRGLRDLLALPEGTSIAITPSGTDAMYLAAALCQPGDGRPLHHVAVGLAEMGRGTGLAAEGRHFTALPPRPGSRARVGDPLDGWDAAAGALVDIPLRDPTGAARDAGAVDTAVRSNTVRLLRDGGRVMVSANAGSKTGATGPGDPCLRELAREQAEVRLLVDAAQGRLSPESVRAHLAANAMVVFTSSKFHGAPPFAGALLIPAGVMPGDSPAPRGLGDYLCRSALPDNWSHVGAGWPEWHNDGLWLRWELGLLGLARYLAIAAEARTAVGARFTQAFEETLGHSPHLLLAEPLRGGPEQIGVVLVRRGDGVLCGDTEMARLHRQLVCDGLLLGQPVRLAPGRAALRVSLSGPLVARLAVERDHGLGWMQSTFHRLAARIAHHVSE